MSREHAPLSTSLRRVPANRVVKLDNTKCAYCAAPLTKDNETKEHVIGRKFVPKGKLNGQWNLILRACQTCNSKKADLEDDISAITMQPDIVGRYSHDDISAHEIAQHKAGKTISRRTGEIVGDSHENISFSMPLGEVARMSFNFTSPAQIDETRAFELARLQLVGFFYWITYNEEIRHGRYWVGGFHPMMMTRRSDWGNSIMRGFADAVLDWEPRVAGCTADGFYKVMMRRHPGAECWSWAIEWNHDARLIGFAGDRAAAEALVQTFPSLETNIIHQNSERYVYHRSEVPLEEDDDLLFYWDEESMGSESMGSELIDFVKRVDAIYV